MLVARAVRQNEVMVEAEEVEIHVEAVDEEEEEELVEDRDEDVVDNIWMKCQLTQQTTMRKNMTIYMNGGGVLIGQIYEEDDQYGYSEEEIIKKRPGQVMIYETSV